MDGIAVGLPVSFIISGYYEKESKKQTGINYDP